MKRKRVSVAGKARPKFGKVIICFSALISIKHLDHMKLTSTHHLIRQTNVTNVITTKKSIGPTLVEYGREKKDKITQQN